jgi:thymidylate kinase
MIIMVSGKQGSGKSTLVTELAAYFTKLQMPIRVVRFAGAIYEMHDACRSILKKYKIGGQYDYSKKDGPLLQLLGTEWGRNTIYKGIWVDCVRNLISDISKYAPETVFLIEDLRFKDEFTMCDSALKIRLECDREIRKQRCSMWRDNETHQSETDLDDWLDRFDLVLDSGKFNADQILKMSVNCIMGVDSGRSDEISSGAGAEPS